MRVQLQQTAIGTGLGAAVPPLDLIVDGSAPVVIAVQTDERPLLVSMLLAGRIRSDSGRALVDGREDADELRRRTALVDTPIVAEPTAGIALKTVVAEEFSFAGLSTSGRAVRAFLADHGLADYASLPMRALLPADRIRLLCELAVLREGVDGIIVTSPERHGGEPVDWYEPLAALAERGVTVAVVTDYATAGMLVALGARDGSEPEPEPEPEPEAPAEPIADTPKTLLKTPLKTPPKATCRENLPLVRAEFARLTASRIGIASLIALMTVPLVYGGLYLWGNQDPYSSLDKVPAALVVQDAGTTVDGTTTNYGEKAAKNLLSDEKFGWVEVTAAQASAGVKNGTYDFGITFPADFSARLASASGDSPRSATLQLTTDDTNSYLSTTIAKQASEAVRVEIAKEVGAKASITLLNAVGDLRDGLVKADDGASKLADGAATAATGAASLDSGSATLASGAGSLASGLAQLDAKASALPASAAQLSSGASSVSTGAANASTGSATLAGKAGQVATLASGTRSQVAAELAAAGVDPTVAATVDAQLAGVSGATAQVGTGASSLSSSLGALASGAAQVSTGAATLKSSAPALASAVHSASTGAASLAGGAGELASGASALQSGTAEIATGSATLTSSLTDAVAKVPVTTAAGRQATANLIANPLAVKQSAITQAANYGAGLAPFFLALASWIGIYALFLLVRPLSRRALTAVRRPIRTTLAGWLTPAMLGVVQMVALFALVTLALHLPVANPVGLVAFMAFVAMTFAAIVLALNVLLGSVGQFLALVFMVVQLVTAGGTFPWQTLPGPLAVLHQALPMSHAVDGIRQLMYGGLSASVWSSIVPLLLWLVGALAVSVLGAMRQGRFRILRELRPSPIGA